MSAGLTPVQEGAVPACLTPVLEGHSVCRFNSSPGGPVSAGLTPVLEGVLCLQV